jgi:hypothetical protein
MGWPRLLACITGTVDQELLLRNEYLAAENRILRAQIKGRLCQGFLGLCKFNEEHRQLDGLTFGFPFQKGQCVALPGPTPISSAAPSLSPTAPVVLRRSSSGRRLTSFSS